MTPRTLVAWKMLGTTLSFVAALLLIVPTADATAVMKIFDGTTTLTIVDGGAGDMSADAGVILFNGAIGTWTINVTTGISKPVLGSAINPHMDLNTVNVTSSAGGTLTIWFTDVDFEPFSGSLVTHFGGTTANSLEFDVFADAGNSAFGEGIPLFSFGPFGAGAFSGDASVGVSLAGLFSLTERLMIVHTGQQGSSGDFEIRVPEPSILLLLGACLVALGIWKFRVA